MSCAPHEAGFEDGTLNYLSIPAVEIGLRHLERAGVDTIQRRTDCLTGWLLAELLALRHANGRPVVRVYGPSTCDARGGTVTMNFYDPNGTLLDFRRIEELAGQEGISLRTGCFCNPGAGETAERLTEDDMRAGLAEGADLTLPRFLQLMQQRGDKSLGAIRVSFGVATNLADVERFLRFAAGFRDRTLVAVGDADGRRPELPRDPRRQLNQKKRLPGFFFVRLLELAGLIPQRRRPRLVVVAGARLFDLRAGLVQLRLRQLDDRAEAEVVARLGQLLRLRPPDRAAGSSGRDAETPSARRAARPGRRALTRFSRSRSALGLRARAQARFGVSRRKQVAVGQRHADVDADRRIVRVERRPAGTAPGPPRRSPRSSETRARARRRRTSPTIRAPGVPPTTSGRSRSACATSAASSVGGGGRQRLLAQRVDRRIGLTQRGGEGGEGRRGIVARLEQQELRFAQVDPREADVEARLQVALGAARRPDRRRADARPPCPAPRAGSPAPAAR